MHMNTKALVMTCSSVAFLFSASAAPVTGWTVGLDNANTVSLSNAGTSSPTLGDNTAEDADNTSIYAAFPSVTLGVGDKLTFSGSMQLSTSVGLAPTAMAAEFRFGVFNENSSSGLGGWLGYYATSPSGATGAGLRRRNVSTANYYSSTGTSIVLTNFVADSSMTFVDELYDFSLTLERTSTGILLTTTLENDQGYSLVPLTYEDTAANTATFNRVGFLAGGNLNVDQIQFSNIDVTVTQVPEPSIAAFLLLGVAVLGRSSKLFCANRF